MNEDKEIPYPIDESLDNAGKVKRYKENLIIRAQERLRFLRREALIIKAKEELRKAEADKLFKKNSEE